MKYDWKKAEKTIYAPNTKPSIVDVPTSSFILIKGFGNPNSEAFQKRVEALYSLSYAMRMSPKKGIAIPGYYEYTVYPLEGFWDLTEKGRTSATLWKDELLYTLMIKQPPFVTREVFEQFKRMVKENKKNLLIEEVNFLEITEGLSVQMLHIGSYDDENKSFKLMQDFIKEHNYEIKTLVHKEIYLSDPRKTEPQKLRTILRYHIKSKD